MSRKRWIALLIFLVLFVVYAVFQSMAAFPVLGVGNDEWREEVFQQGGPERIALLTVEGTILEQSAGNLFSGPLYNHRLFLKQLKQAFQDETVRAVVLRVNSPGGGIVESDEIYRTIMELKEEYDKPVVASMGNTAASGGYYISAAADQIVAASGTITGSIGVIVSSLNVKELADQWGIKQEAITSGPHKNMLSPLKEMSPEERAILQDLVDEAYQNFVDVVVQGRGLDREKVLQLADGRIYSGEQAKAAGLVDELGYLDDAIDQAAELANIENPTVITYVQTGWSMFNTLMTTWRGSETMGLESMIPLDSSPKVMYLLNW
jgi:protease-4